VSAALHKDAPLQAAYENMSQDFIAVDEALLVLLKKHAKSEPKWRRIAQELEKLTGVKKSEHWCKKHAKILLNKIERASDRADGHLDPKTDVMLDQVAGELAFEETMKLLTQRFPDFIPKKCSMEIGDASGAVLWMLRRTVDLQEQSLFFRGVAIQTIHSEGHAAATALLEVSAYLESHPESRQALRELQALVCFSVGLQLAGNVGMISELSMTKVAVELFAWASLLSDMALSLFVNKQEQQMNTFAIFEGMKRCSDKVLRNDSQDFASLLVQSRLQHDDDHAKLALQKKCIAALDLGMNADWVMWKGRVHEMIGLTYGGMGNFQAAGHAYELALISSKSRNTMYLRAQCLHSMDKYQKANELLSEYFTAVSDDAAYDDYLFPNALYLRATICMGQKDLDGSRSYHKFATAAEESSRCLFYGPVNCAAKRSLGRVFSVCFGDQKERQAALMEFAALFRRKNAGTNIVNLEDVDPEALISETPDKSTSSDSSTLRAHILTLSRHPSSLRDALLNSYALSPCCTALEEHGMNPELPSGAKLFCNPDDFELVLSSLGDQALMQWHVVVTSEFLDAVHEAVSSLRSKEQVRLKSDTPVEVSLQRCQFCDERNPRYRCPCEKANYCSQRCQKMDYSRHVKTCTRHSELYIVSKTFIDIKLPDDQQAARSTTTKSTTDANPRKGKNPRGSSVPLP